jgi:aminoglycoside phosphotransferase (APT) family kinase protein
VSAERTGQDAPSAQAGVSTAGRGQDESVDLAALASVLRVALGTDIAVTGLVPISIGASNRMYRADTSGGPLILRVPPRHKTSPTAHDVGREFRVLRALDQTTVPHPRALALSADTSLFGVGFLVMQFVDGFNLRADRADPLDLSPAERGEYALAAVDALADLGAVDWQAAGLSGYGRPDGFLARQVQRWSSQLEGYRVRDLPGLDQLARWLQGNQPAHSRSAIMHGDFTYMNVMFAPSRPARVAAIVDWEQSTIGDPLLDLGWFVGLWSHHDEDAPATPPGVPWVTQRPGMPTRQQVIARYQERAGLEELPIGFYQALALFKLAVVLEGNYAKYHGGVSRNQHHADFEWMVPALIDTALAATRGER